FSRDWSSDVCSSDLLISLACIHLNDVLLSHLLIPLLLMLAIQDKLQVVQIRYQLMQLNPNMGHIEKALRHVSDMQLKKHLSSRLHVIEPYQHDNDQHQFQQVLYMRSPNLQFHLLYYLSIIRWLHDNHDE